VSATDYADRLNDLRLLARRRPELSARDQADQLVLYADKLRAFDRRDVETALARTWKFWPEWAELEDAVKDARNERTAGVRAEVSRGWRPNLAQAANAALGLLSNAHVRELERLREKEPVVHQQIVNDIARWFEPHASAALAARGDEIREFRVMATERVERELGKPWRRILDEEAAARGTSAPVGAIGFSTMGQASRAVVGSGLASIGRPSDYRKASAQEEDAA
jgi:hypothetical protein